MVVPFLVWLWENEKMGSSRTSRVLPWAGSPVSASGTISSEMLAMIFEKMLSATENK